MWRHQLWRHQVRRFWVTNLTRWIMVVAVWPWSLTISGLMGNSTCQTGLERKWTRTNSNWVSSDWDSMSRQHKKCNVILFCSLTHQTKVFTVGIWIPDGLVFEWQKAVWSRNGVKLEWHLNTAKPKTASKAYKCWSSFAMMVPFQ